MIHYKACAKTRKEKLADIALMVFGFVAAVYTTVQTIRVRSLGIHSPSYPQ
jgi:proton-coupled amino acid transporter